jgi:hypothetical protein
LAIASACASPTITIASAPLSIFPTSSNETLDSDTN